MTNFEFKPAHLEEMASFEQKYENCTMEEVETLVRKGAEIVEKNGGFAKLDTKLEAHEMDAVTAFIDFRNAKRDLGEYVEEIDT